MRPARQGDFDGFCGLYALINALDPAGLGGPRKPLHRDMFVALAQALPPRKLSQAVADGLMAEDLIEVAGAAFPQFKKALGGQVTVSLAFEETYFDTDDDFLQAIRDVMLSGRSGIIMMVHTPTFRHWTVPSSITETEIVIRDSWGLKSLDRGRYTIKRGRYRIHPGDTLLLHFRPLKRLA